MADDALLSHQQQQEDGNLWDGEYPVISSCLISSLLDAYVLIQEFGVPS